MLFCLKSTTESSSVAYSSGRYFQPGCNSLLFSCLRPGEGRTSPPCRFWKARWVLPAGGLSLRSGSFYSEKEEFLLPGGMSSSSRLGSKNYNSPWLCFPPFPLRWRLPRARRCREAASACLPPPRALGWTLSCRTRKRAFWWVHTLMFCLLLLLTRVHLSWCFSQMVTIRPQMVSPL